MIAVRHGGDYYNGDAGDGDTIIKKMMLVVMMTMMLNMVNMLTTTTSMQTNDNCVGR